MVTNTPYITICIQGQNNYTNYGTIPNICTKSMNAFINFCKYLHKLVSCMVLSTLIRISIFNVRADGDRITTCLVYFYGLRQYGI